MPRTPNGALNAIDIIPLYSPDPRLGVGIGHDFLHVPEGNLHASVSCLWRPASNLLHKTNSLKHAISSFRTRCTWISLVLTHCEHGAVCARRVSSQLRVARVGALRQVEYGTLEIDIDTSS
jgi:hypothetical protein